MTQTVTSGKAGLQIGDRLRDARNEAGLTIAALARELDVDPRTVARWQQGASRPSYERLVRLAELVGKPPSYFLGGFGETGTPPRGGAA